MRNVVVTGGSRGLGLGIVRRLVAEGYRAIAVARSTERPAGVRDGPSGGIRAGAVHFVPFDLGDIEDIPELVKTAAQRTWADLRAGQQRGARFERRSRRSCTTRRSSS